MIDLKELNETQRELLKEAFPYQGKNHEDTGKLIDVFNKFCRETDYRYVKKQEGGIGSMNEFQLAVAQMKRKSRLNPYKGAEEVERKIISGSPQEQNQISEILYKGLVEFNRRKDIEARSK